MYSLNIIMYSTNTVNIKTVDDKVRGNDTGTRCLHLSSYFTARRFVDDQKT